MYGYIILSGTCALVVPWHVSGFGYTTELDSIKQLRVDTDLSPEPFLTHAVTIKCQKLIQYIYV